VPGTGPLSRKVLIAEYLCTSGIFEYALRQMTDRPVQTTIAGATPINQTLLHYSYLQVLDFLTTIAFLVNGVEEANPLVRFALAVVPNPIGGLIAVKLLAGLLGLYCWRLGRQRLLARINILFAILVAWNLVALIVATLHH